MKDLKTKKRGYLRLKNKRYWYYCTSIKKDGQWREKAEYLGTADAVYKYFKRGKGK